MRYGLEDVERSWVTIVTTFDSTKEVTYDCSGSGDFLRNAKLSIMHTPSAYVPPIISSFQRVSIHTYFSAVPQRPIPLV